MVSFENFVKSMPPSLSELKVTPSFCFPFKIPDDPTATSIEYVYGTPLTDYTMVGAFKIYPKFIGHFCLLNQQNSDSNT